MLLTIIVAVAKNGVIGVNNTLPWRLSADLKFFKQTTTGHHIIMGRKTYESIGKPLPNRTTVIVTRQKAYSAEGCLVAHSLEEGVEIAKKNGDAEAFLIGGGELYQQGVTLCDKIHLTKVDASPEGDAFFPELDPKEWLIVNEEQHKADEKNQFDFTFVEMKKA
ncbi:dihydrofolate reductase [Flammeovirgaceae bacterium SG7u.111]|nr:dihydrofolate reductase [Flammeovirgaceae bacterium SG7u.132]WPO33990.1 dihydrofolate reductase [Flammeovirgaceae bacterium SG7u.111]